MIRMIYNIVLYLNLFFIVMFFMLYFLIRKLEKWNTKEGRLKNIIKNFLINILDLTSDWTVIVGKSFIVLALLLIVSETPLKKAGKYISDIYTKSPGILNIIIGALLASLLGIFTQRYMNAINNRKEIRTYSRLLYNDLNNIINRLEFTRDIIKTPEFHKIDIWSLNSITKINFDTSWRENYSFLTQCLTNEHYNKISNIYTAADLFNKGVEKKDLSEINHCILSMMSDDEYIKILGYASPTNKMLLGDLERLSNNKKVKRLNIKILLDELIYIRRKRKIFDAIESEAYEILKKDGKQSILSIINKINEKFKSSDNEVYENIKTNRERLIREVLRESKYIEYVWGECYLAEAEINNN